MKEICKRRDIMVVRGDVLEVYFELIGISTDLVESVEFISKKADLSIVCPYSDLQQGYCLRLGSDITEGLLPVIATYDLNVKLVNGETITAIYECVFAILKKRNSIEKEGTDGC